MALCDTHTITYIIGCSDNNRAHTVLELLREGVARFGLPDHEVESLANQMIADQNGSRLVWFHFDVRIVMVTVVVHSDRSFRIHTLPWVQLVCHVFKSMSEVYGISVRNGNFERKWNPLYFAVFFTLSLNCSSILDPLINVDLCLFLNRCLGQFCESWNNHG